MEHLQTQKPPCIQCQLHRYAPLQFPVAFRSHQQYYLKLKKSNLQPKDHKLKYFPPKFKKMFRCYFLYLFDLVLIQEYFVHQRMLDLS